MPLLPLLHGASFTSKEHTRAIRLPAFLPGGPESWLPWGSPLPALRCPGYVAGTATLLVQGHGQADVPIMVSPGTLEEPRSWGHILTESHCRQGAGQESSLHAALSPHHSSRTGGHSAISMQVNPGMQIPTAGPTWRLTLKLGVTITTSISHL